MNDEVSYRAAGVDIAAGDAFIRRITPIANATTRAGVLSALGGFAALFDPRAAGFADPILVIGTDGVGTKLKLAIDLNRHRTIGIDLVAMCVNDVVVQGADPVLFLDYFATGKLDPFIAADVIQGVADGCRIAGCALVGGETAEMPGFYPEGHYDLAGFAVGIACRDRLLPGNVQAGDVLLGLPSSGVHSNGFSLVRHICQQNAITWDQPLGGRSLGEVFLTPTTIYVKLVLDLHRNGLLQAAAHITGGGLIGNIPRVLPRGLTVRIDQSWPVPAEFGWLQQIGHLSHDEMLRTFNCGIGMVLVVAKDQVDAAIAAIGTHLYPYSYPYLLGAVVEGEVPQIKLPM